MIIPIKQILTEDTSLMDQYTDQLKAYSDLNNRGLAPEERFAMFNGINTLNNTNPGMDNYIDPLSFSSKLIPDASIIQTYKSLGDKDFVNNASNIVNQQNAEIQNQNNLIDHQKQVIDNTYNQGNIKAAGAGLLGAGLAFGLANRYNRRR